jgi:hypothetical protein
VRLYIAHSLAGFDFHDHRPAVRMHQHLLRDLDERILWHFNSTSGSSRIASSASLHTEEHIHLSISSQWLTSFTEPRVAALISATGLHRGIVRPLSLVTSRLNPHLSARYRGQSILTLSRIGIVQYNSTGGPPNQVVLPLLSQTLRYRSSTIGPIACN